MEISVNAGKKIKSLYEKYRKVVKENERLKEKLKKGKIIQTITAWRYPCEKVIEYIDIGADLPCFTKDGHYCGSLPWEWKHFEISRNIQPTRKLLLKESGYGCSCGKGCKPQKVRIIVEEV